MFNLLFAMAAAALTLLVSPIVRADVEADLPDYHTVSGIAGSVSSVGSDTLANLMTLWAEAFKRQYPNVSVQIQAAGSSTAPAALIEGTANLGPMSRKMKDKEAAAFETRHGYKPTPIRVAIDALAVFVHKDNPLMTLTLPQVDAIFSATRLCGHPENISQWQQLGVNLGRMQLYGRNSVSGTYGYFKEHALCKGDFKNNVNEQPGSASVVQGVTTSLNGIGYSGIGYKTSSVKALSIATQADKPPVEATIANAANGQYPLSRYLYVYINKAPNKPLTPIDREFMTMILSKLGQQVVVKDGYVPLPAAVIEQELNKLQ